MSRTSSGLTGPGGRPPPPASALASGKPGGSIYERLAQQREKLAQQRARFAANNTKPPGIVPLPPRNSNSGPGKHAGVLPAAALSDKPAAVLGGDAGSRVEEELGQSQEASIGASKATEAQNRNSNRLSLTTSQAATGPTQGPFHAAEEDDASDFFDTLAPGISMQLVAAEALNTKHLLKNIAFCIRRFVQADNW